jgi:heptosyltransferase-2/heptosyltransferase-3
MLIRSSGAKNRVGFAHYRYPRFYNHLFSGAQEFWRSSELHSAEQQLALLGLAGVPVADHPQSRLAVTEEGARRAEARIRERFGADADYAVLHPAAAFATKEWPPEHFAEVAKYLFEKGLKVLALATRREQPVLDRLAAAASVPVAAINDATLPEITALLSRARLFVGNDSGLAHIAAAVSTPLVVIFGSSNRVHWRPWTQAPYEIVFKPFHCQPCPGDRCREFGTPRCILEIPPGEVLAAVERVLAADRSVRTPLA